MRISFLLCPMNTGRHKMPNDLAIQVFTVLYEQRGLHELLEQMLG